MDFDHLKKNNTLISFLRQLGIWEMQTWIKVVKALLLFRSMIEKNFSVNTYELPNGDTQKACSTSLQGRPWLEIQTCGSSECRLLKPASGLERLGNHESLDKPPHENRNLENSVFQGKQQSASKDPKQRESFKKKDEMHNVNNNSNTGQYLSPELRGKSQQRKRN